jgi:hypothetical protein
MTILRVFGVCSVLALAACSAEDSSQMSAEDLATLNEMFDSPQVCTPGQADPRACDPADTKKTTICHLPPGNPANAHTLCVGNPAVKAHLAHGDHLGSCCGTGTGGTGGTGGGGAGGAGGGGAGGGGGGGAGGGGGGGGGTGGSGGGGGDTGSPDMGPIGAPGGGGGGDTGTGPIG